MSNDNKVLRGSWRTHAGYVFLSAEDMEKGQEKVLTIKQVTREDAYDKSSGKNKSLISIAFNETDRLMALNATNAKTISVIAGSPMVEKWEGIRVALYRTEETFFGKVGALRVKEAPAAVTPIQQQQVAES